MSKEDSMGMDEKAEQGRIVDSPVTVVHSVPGVPTQLYTSL